MVPEQVCALLVTALEGLVTALEQAPDTPLCQVQVLSAVEREQVVAGWNETAVVVPGVTVPGLFADRRWRGARMRWRWRTGTAV